MATIDCGPEYPGRPPPFYLIGNQLPFSPIQRTSRRQPAHRGLCQVWDVRTCQRIHEFKDMLKGSRQSSSHPMDLFWRRHLVTTPYVYGICMFASHCTGLLHLPCSVAMWNHLCSHICRGGGSSVDGIERAAVDAAQEFPDEIIRCMVIVPE